MRQCAGRGRPSAAGSKLEAAFRTATSTAALLPMYTQLKQHTRRRSGH